MPPKILYFDMGNVLLSFSHQQAAEQMAIVAGIAPELSWQIVFDEGLQWECERGAIDRAEFHRRFCERAKTRPELEPLDRAGSAIFELSPRILPLLGALRGAGYRLGVLSNTSRSHWRYVTARFPFLASLFHLHALSYELGAMKPDEAIYQRAEELAGCSGREIFFADDRAENVTAARNRGWNAVLFTSPAKLAVDLVPLGIRVNY